MLGSFPVEWSYQPTSILDKVILTGAELGKYFGKETTPREMKDQIIKLLDDWKGQQKEVAKPEKKAAPQEK